MSYIYNAYLPKEDTYEKIPGQQTPPFGGSFFGSLFHHDKNKKNAGFSGIFQKLRLDNWDSGDFLLLLILFLLIREGDKSDAVVALAIAVLLLLEDSG